MSRALSFEREGSRMEDANWEVAYWQQLGATAAGFEAEKARRRGLETALKEQASRPNPYCAAIASDLAAGARTTFGLDTGGPKRLAAYRRYTLVNDESGHTFICPVEREAEARAMLDALEAYWRDGDSGTPPPEPDFLVRV